MTDPTINSAPVVEQEYPFLGERVQSSFIDLLFIVLLMFIFSFFLDKAEDVQDWVRIVLFVFIWLIYEPLFTSLGSTIGNYVKGIRVRRHDATNKRISFPRALLRYIFKMALGWLSFITIHGDPEKRAIHDLVAGSVMIRR